jgi:hypothetical protein
MAEKPILIATFMQAVEAQVACGRLRAEGIAAYVTGDVDSSAFPGMTGIAGRLELYVPEAEVRRAEAILEACRREQRVTAGLEEREPEGPVWVCSLCGDAVPVSETVCAACGTSREALRSGPSRDLQENRPARRPSPEDLQKDEPASGGHGGDSGLEMPELENLNRGDALAARALKASAICVLFSPVVLLSTGCVLLVIVPFVVLAFWFLGQLFLYKGELSPRAMRRFYLALALDLVIGLGVLAFLARFYFALRR